MHVRLTVIAGAKSQSIRLKLPTLVGRSRDASLKVPAALVSRKHCELYDEGGLLVVHDLGSSNGTFLNGERLSEPAFFLPGEHLRVGPLTFSVSYDVPPEHAHLLDADVPPSESEPPPDDSSVVTYGEHASGSFLEVVEHRVSPTAAVPRIDTGEPPPKQASRSGLRDFFENLE